MGDIGAVPTRVHEEEFSEGLTGDEKAFLDEFTKFLAKSNYQHVAKGLKVQVLASHAGRIGTLRCCAWCVDPRTGKLYCCKMC
jgi:hypothetical protein